MHKSKSEMVEWTIQYAEKVTRELLPLAPKEALMLDVTTAQLKVMFTVFFNGVMRMGYLARALGVSLPTMTSTVNRLVKRGILIREADPEDRRAVSCRLSEYGQQMVNQLWNSARERTKEILNKLSVEELETVERALKILLKAGEMTRSKETVDEI